MKNLFTFKNLGWFLSGLVTLMMVMSGINKVIGTADMVNTFASINLSSSLIYVGFLEIVSAFLLMYPRTSVYGALGVSSLMSGVVAIHLSYMGGAGVIVPIMIGLIAWTGHCLRTYTK